MQQRHILLFLTVIVATKDRSLKKKYTHNSFSTKKKNRCQIGTCKLSNKKERQTSLCKSMQNKHGSMLIPSLKLYICNPR